MDFPDGRLIPPNSKYFYQAPSGPDTESWECEIGRFQSCLCHPTQEAQTAIAAIAIREWLQEKNRIKALGSDKEYIRGQYATYEYHNPEHLNEFIQADKQIELWDKWGNIWIETSIFGTETKDKKDV